MAPPSVSSPGSSWGAFMGSLGSGEQIPLVNPAPPARRSERDPSQAASRGQTGLCFPKGHRDCQPLTPQPLTRVDPTYPISGLQAGNLPLGGNRLPPPVPSHLVSQGWGRTGQAPQGLQAPSLPQSCPRRDTAETDSRLPREIRYAFSSPSLACLRRNGEQKTGHAGL